MPVPRRSRRVSSSPRVPRLTARRAPGVRPGTRDGSCSRTALRRRSRAASEPRRRLLGHRRRPRPGRTGGARRNLRGRCRARSDRRVRDDALSPDAALRRRADGSAHARRRGARAAWRGGRGVFGAGTPSDSRRSDGGSSRVARLRSFHFAMIVGTNDKRRNAAMTTPAMTNGCPLRARTPSRSRSPT